MHPVRRFWRLLQLDRKEIAYIYIYAFFGGLITLSLPLGVQAIIGLIAGNSVSSSWVLLIGVVTFGTLLAGVLTVMQQTVIETFQRRLFVRSAFDFAYRLPRMKTEALYREYGPELVNRFFETMTLQKGMPKILVDCSTSLLQVLFGLVLLSFYHPFFIFFGFLLLLILALIFRVTGPQGVQTSLHESKYKFEVAYWLEEIARSMGTFKMASSSELPMRKTDKLVGKYLDARKRHFRVLMTQYMSIVAFKTLITAGLLVLGCILFLDNRINLGQFVAAEIIIILIMAAVEKLILTMEIIYDVLASLDKLGFFTDLPVEDEKGICFEEIDTGEGINVEIVELSYRFPDEQKDALDHISLSLSAGEKVCVAGYSGSGKSTLLGVVNGLYTDFTGSLNFNKIPFRNLNAASLRVHIGDHNPYEDIFKGTLLENISMGYSNVSLQVVIEAVEKVGLVDFVRRLPEGYDTVLFSEGKNLPRGIISKIILARSIASQPSLLAIEEPFTYLEKEDREHLSLLLTDRKQKWTLLAVTNDPLMAANCDRVVIMQEGRIVEQGTYAQIKKSIHFKQIFKI